MGIGYKCQFPKQWLKADKIGDQKGWTPTQDVLASLPKIQYNNYAEFWGLYLQKKKEVFQENAQTNCKETIAEIVKIEALFDEKS